MRHRSFHKEPRQGRSMLWLLPTWWGCPKLCLPEQDFYLPRQAEWTNKDRQNGSLPSPASTNKEDLKSSQKICCNSAVVDRKKRIITFLLYQAASRQEVSQLQLSPMVRQPKAPKENLATLKNCSQTTGNIIPLKGISSSCFMPKHIKVPKGTSPSLTQL